MPASAFFDVIKGVIQCRAHLAELVSGVNLYSFGQVAVRHLFEDPHRSPQARGDAASDKRPDTASEYERGEHERHDK